MFNIENRTISLTRGDTARIEIAISNTVTDEPYELQDGDTILLTVKRTTNSPEKFQKSASGSNTIHIRPEDTKDMTPGRYMYDVEVRTAAGDVYTVIPVSEFNLLPEVTC